MTPQKQSKQSLLSQQRSSVQEREDLIFELFQKTGMFGAYQKVSLVFWCVSCYICGGITLIIPFLLYQDPYDCPQPHPSMTCEEFVCSLAQEQRWQYVPAPIMSTMADKFGDYRCPIDSQQLDISVMIIYSSAIVAYVILTFFGDYLGRKRLMQIGLLLVLGGLAMTIFSVNLVMGSVGMMISCLGCEWIYTMSLLFISETVSSRYRDQFLVISQTFYGVGHLGNAAFFYFIRDWQLVFIYLYAIPALLVLLVLSIFVVDTPICLIDYLTANKARKALFWVANINGKKDFYVTLDQIKEVKMMEKARSGDQKQGSKFTLVDLFRYPSLRWMTIGSILIANTIFFLFYAPTLMIAELDLDIFASGLIIGSSSLVAYPFCYFAITRVKRKVMALLSFGLVFAFSLVLVFIWRPQIDEQEVSDLQQAITMILFFLISFTITSEYIFFQIYVLELYPTQIRVIGTSFVQIIGSIGISFVNFIIDGCEDSGFSIMIVFCIVAALSVAISTQLPQTLDKVPPDFIREIASHHSHLTHSKRESQTNAEIDEGK